MELGFWLNYETGEEFRIDEHERWIRRWDNAKKIGIDEKTFKEYTKKFKTSEDRNKFLLWLMNRFPIIRVRGHGSTTTFEFANERVRSVLDTIYEFGQKYAGNYSHFHITNLKKNKNIDILYKDFKKLYEDGRENVIMEKYGKDIKLLPSFKQFLEEKLKIS